jgi:hypothetical protein
MQVTKEQADWLKANKSFIRISHAKVKITNAGTLHADGTFVPASGRSPAMDGANMISVGVPVLKRRR